MIPAPNVCSSCGASRRDGADFCHNCGAGLAPPEEGVDARSQKRRAAPLLLGVGIAAAMLGALAGVGGILLLSSSDDADSAVAVQLPSDLPRAEREPPGSQRDDPSPPESEPAAVPPPRPPVVRRIDLVPVARAISGAGRCFRTTPGRRTGMILDGIRYEQRNLQCGSEAGDNASGGFVVDVAGLAKGASITIREFDAMVGVDESSGATRSTGEWQVSYGGTVICSAQAVNGASVRCARQGLSIPVTPGVPLRLTQSIRPDGSGLSLWAGYHIPELVVAIAPESPSGTGR